MEWERAKTTILVIFLLLNIALGGLRFFDHQRYSLTFEQEQNIRSVLNRHNIQLYTLPIRFAPMRPIEISGFYYTDEFLTAVFFDGYPVSSYEDEWGVYVMVSDDGRRLEISNGFIFFETGHGGYVNSEPVSRAFAAAKTGEFIGRHFGNFELDIVLDAFDFYGNHGIRRIYREKYQGVLIYSNFVELFVASTGITQIEMQFGRVIGHAQVPPRMIFPPDEVLLTFMQRFYHIAAETPIIINRMDMVYAKLYHYDEIGSVSIGIPFYRIFIMGNDFPLLINAFTNALMH